MRIIIQYRLQRKISVETFMSRTRRWAREEIARLDPSRDAHRIAQLSFETRYGEPILLHGLFSVAFAYNVAEPRIARILYRNGRGPILRQTRKRNFDSMAFFGELYRYGDSPEGHRICERLNRIHANFPIDNDLSLYTLSTLALLPRRFSESYGGRNAISQKENTAQFAFWRMLGEWMGIEELPETPDQFLEWMLSFEQKQFAPSAEADAILAVLREEWADYWFPRWLQKPAQGLFMALIDPTVRRRMNWPEPTRLQNFIALKSLRLYFWARERLPDPAERRISDFFARDYGEQPNLEKLGVQYDKTPPAEPG